MMYLTLVATVILGCILAIGPPAVWKGRLMDDDASRLPRFLACSSPPLVSAQS